MKLLSFKMDKSLLADLTDSRPAPPSGYALLQAANAAERSPSVAHEQAQWLIQRLNTRHKQTPHVIWKCLRTIKHLSRSSVEFRRAVRLHAEELKQFVTFRAENDDALEGHAPSQRVVMEAEECLRAVFDDTQLIMATDKGAKLDFGSLNSQQLHNYEDGYAVGLRNNSDDESTNAYNDERYGGYGNSQARRGRSQDWDAGNYRKPHLAKAIDLATSIQAAASSVIGAATSLAEKISRPSIAHDNEWDHKRVVHDEWHNKSLKLSSESKGAFGNHISTLDKVSNSPYYQSNSSTDHSNLHEKLHSSLSYSLSHRNECPEATNNAFRRSGEVGGSWNASDSESSSARYSIVHHPDAVPKASHMASVLPSASLNAEYGLVDSMTTASEMPNMPTAKDLRSFVRQAETLHLETIMMLLFGKLDVPGSSQLKALCVIDALLHSTGEIGTHAEAYVRLHLDDIVKLKVSSNPNVKARAIAVLELCGVDIPQHPISSSSEMATSIATLPNRSAHAAADLLNFDSLESNTARIQSSSNLKGNLLDSPASPFIFPGSSLSTESSAITAATVKTSSVTPQIPSATATAVANTTAMTEASLFDALNIDSAFDGSLMSGLTSKKEIEGVDLSESFSVSRDSSLPLSTETKPSSKRQQTNPLAIFDASHISQFSEDTSQHQHPSMLSILNQPGVQCSDRQPNFADKFAFQTTSHVDFDRSVRSLPGSTHSYLNGAVTIEPSISHYHPQNAMLSHSMFHTVGLQPQPLNKIQSNKLMTGGMSSNSSSNFSFMNSSTHSASARPSAQSLKTTDSFAFVDEMLKS